MRRGSYRTHRFYSALRESLQTRLTPSGSIPHPGVRRAEDPGGNQLETTSNTMHQTTLAVLDRRAQRGAEARGPQRGAQQPDRRQPGRRQPRCAPAGPPRSSAPARPFSPPQSCPAAGTAAATRDATPAHSEAPPQCQAAPTTGRRAPDRQRLPRTQTKHSRGHSAAGVRRRKFLAPRPARLPPPAAGGAAAAAANSAASEDPGGQ